MDGGSTSSTEDDFVSTASSSSDEASSTDDDGSDVTSSNRSTPLVPGISTWERIWPQVTTNSGNLSSHYDALVIRSLQQKIDPYFKAPIVITGVRFNQQGQLVQIEVLSKSDSERIASRLENLPANEREASKGRAQKEAKALRATLGKRKTIEVSPAGIAASARMSRVMKQNRGTAASFAESLGDAARAAVETSHSMITGSLAETVNQISRTLRVNEKLDVKGLLRVSAGDQQLQELLIEKASGSVYFQAGKPGSEHACGDALKSMLRTRTNKVLRSSSVKNLNQEIDSLDAASAIRRVKEEVLDKLGKQELEIWRAAINFYHLIEKHQAVNGKDAMDAGNLAIVTWETLFESDGGPMDIGPRELVAHLIKHAPDYFDQPNYKAALIKRSRTSYAKSFSSTEPLLPSWKLLFKALCDARDAFGHLPEKFGFKYDKENIPMRDAFQNGRVKPTLEVPSGFDESFKSGGFLEHYGMLLSNTPGPLQPYHLNWIDLPLLRVLEEIRRKMAGKFDPEQRLQLLSAMAGGEGHLAFEIMGKALSPSERLHLRVACNLFKEVCETVKAHADASIDLGGLLSNLYPMIGAILGMKTSDLERLWLDEYPDSAMFAEKTKAAARNLFSAPAKYFG